MKQRFKKRGGKLGQEVDALENGVGLEHLFETFQVRRRNSDLNYTGVTLKWSSVRKRIFVNESYK